MDHRTREEQERHKAQAAEWTQSNIVPIMAQIEAFATKTARGNPPEARKFLRDHAGKADIITLSALTTMVAGVTRQDGLTAIADNVGRSVAKALGVNLARDKGQSLQIGMALVSIICDATGAAAIVDKHGDRPEKQAGGVKLAPTYELQITKGKFLADAVRFGAVGMPTYAKAGPKAWTSQVAGGVPGQHEYGMVHSAEKQMKDCTAAVAPVLYDAVNTAQRARFRVNRGTRDVFAAYDQAAARAWLVEHLMAQGLDEAKAQRAAREAARL